MTALERAVGGERFAPRRLLHQLQLVDPKAELVYIGDGEWWVGTYNPNLKNRKIGDHKVKVAQTMTDVAEARRLDRVGRLQQAGFVFVASYECVGEPDARIARDFEVADFLDKFVVNTDQRFLGTFNEAKNREREAARKDLADSGRAMDAWRYVFNQSHAVSSSLTNQGMEHNRRAAARRAYNNGEHLV
jgi:hypothetical protein